MLQELGEETIEQINDTKAQSYTNQETADELGISLGIAKNLLGCKRG